MAQKMISNLRAKTQDFLEIEDIFDDMVLLKDGSVALILETSAVNFGLLSEEEQDSLIYAYASFLNSLSFPLQIVILSKRMDISSYIELVGTEEQKQQNKILKERLRRYKEFILSIVKENKVLEKKFYLVIQFSVFELGIKGAVFSGSKKLPFSKDYIISRAKTSLFPKKDHILRQLSRFGLKAKQLSTQELVEFFYNVYNPTNTGERLGEVSGYIKPLVEGFSRV